MAVQRQDPGFCCLCLSSPPWIDRRTVFTYSLRLVLGYVPVPLIISQPVRYPDLPPSSACSTANGHLQVATSRDKHYHSRIVARGFAGLFFLKVQAQDRTGWYFRKNTTLPHNLFRDTATQRKDGPSDCGAHRQSNHQMMLSINLTCRPRFIIPTSWTAFQEARCNSS